MNRSDLALVGAGVLGMVTAIVHAILMQKHIVTPLRKLTRTATGLRGAARRLIAPLLHVSVLAWFVGGALLVWVGLRSSGEPRTAVSLAVGVIYLHAAVANAWATRARHPGGIIMATATVLIVTSLLTV